MQGQLFSTDFLLRGIQETETWKGVPDAELDAFIDQLKAHFAPFTADSTLNEGQTEDELIEPVIDLLGWNDAWISQVNLSQSEREDLPDFLLFADPAAKDRALKISDNARARHGVGLLTPSGIAADKGASAFFRTLTAPEEDGAGRLAALYDFENKKGFFPDVDSRFKFCALVFGGAARRFAQTRCAFYLHDVAELADPRRSLQLSGEDFQLVNPNTGAAPIFKTPRDAQLTMQIYRTHPVLVKRSGKDEQRAWPVRYATMFHMTNDSDKFLTCAELGQQGFQPAAMNRWEKGNEKAVPLYEGKMVQLYDHRVADVVVNTKNLHRAAQQEAIQDAGKQQPDRYPAPQFWVKRAEVDKTSKGEWALGFKEITAPTNVRSMIAALMPGVGFGNKVPILLFPQSCAANENAMQAAFLLSNLNSFAFDFVLRQKLQGQTINLFILEQLPVIAPAPFARDLGYVEADGRVKPPFVWNPEDRAHRMARLDALFFHLYGLDDADADYILSTFPIVREQDMKAHGTFRTRDLIMGYLARTRAGSLSHESLA